MTRRQTKEFRPDEALSVISADRAGKSLPCPSCGNATLDRKPPRSCSAEPVCRIQLTCEACGRLVTYIDRSPSSTTH